MIANTAVGFPAIPADAVLFISGSINGVSKAVFGGDIRVSGTMTVDNDVNALADIIMGTAIERMFNTSSAGGPTNFSMASQSIFYVNNPTSNLTANFTDVPETNLRVLTPTVIVSQSVTPRIVSALQIGGAVTPINWANNVVPTGNANKQDVFGFSLIRSGSAWKVLGQMSTYG